MTSEKIKGLVAATVTPMKANGEVNLPALDSYVKHLEKQGLAGVFVNGTTGEGLLMTSDERKAVAEAWMAYKDKFKVMVHVGGTSYAAAVDLARHAEKIGADAISAMGPVSCPRRGPRSWWRSTRSSRRRPPALRFTITTFRARRTSTSACSIS